MQEIYQQAIRKYGRLKPEDLRKTRVYAAKATIDAVIREIRNQANGEFPDADPSIPMTMFGLALRIDDNIPFGIWHFMVEVE